MFFGKLLFALGQIRSFFCVAYFYEIRRRFGTAYFYEIRRRAALFTLRANTRRFLR
nr:MAG TPA: hypothetical protein [Caudoviricetes sp.]